MMQPSPNRGRGTVRRSRAELVRMNVPQARERYQGGRISCALATSFGSAITVRHFRSAGAFRRWLERNYASKKEVWIGYYKKQTGRPSMTWPESVDEALCFGWIDGIRKSVDDLSYTIRFTPRRKTSVWSAINIKRVGVLTKEGRMEAAGLKAFEARRENKSGIYSYEQRREQMEEPYRSVLQKNKRAWSFFQSQPAWYRKQVGWWVISAKKEETRLKRLQRLIECCSDGKRL